jgi:hypothetical protein
MIFLFAASAFAQSETGRYLVPVKKSDLEEGRGSVCVLEQCYYVVDKISAERSVMSGEAKIYYPEVQRKLFAVPDDLRLSSQWHLKGGAVRWGAGWERIKDLPSTGDIPVVAVIDTGITDHEDLPLTALYGGVPYEAKYVSPSTNGLDESGHGTHVAGIVGALTDNNIGVASVSGGKALVMSIRAAYPCRDAPSEVCIGTTAVTNAIGEILNKKLEGVPIVAVNMSFGGVSFNEPEFEAIKSLSDNGIIVVAAAGNDRKDIDNTSYFQYPAEYDLPNIITVAAVSANFNLTGFSNYGYAVNIAAPGDNILSLGLSTAKPYINMSGTSMAAPFIAGLLGAGVALYNKDRGVNYPDITAAQLMNILYDTASVRQFYNPVNGGRLVNVDAFFNRIEECREDAKRTGELCVQAKDSYPIEDVIVPARPAPPNPAPDTGWDSESGGCSLAAGDKKGLPSFILLIISIPLFIAVRRKLNAR